MIKIENFEVFNIEGAIRGMRNPLNSWDISDTVMHGERLCMGCPSEEMCDEAGSIEGHPIVGNKDMELMQNLYKAGPEHFKFMRQIFCSFDVVAPLYWWKEMDTYKVGTTSNSCSTMLTIHKRDLTVDDFSHEHLVKPALEILQNLLTDLNEVLCAYVNYDNWDGREDFEKQGYKKKDLWWQIIQLLPSSYNQRRTLTMSYANLSNIVNQRKHHTLDEWRRFVETILIKAPYLRQIMGIESFAPDLG